MFYTYLRSLLVFLIWAANGNIHYHHRDKLLSKNDNYILVAPHRTLWDPIFLAFAARPKQFIFMAKKELFKNRAFGWWIRMCGAFPIDRNNPGTDAIRYPVKMLKNGDRSLVMFPSGSRHSSNLKGGVAVIAKTAKVKIMPAAYAGPNSIKGLLKHDRIDVTFGNPIDISDIKRMNDEGVEEVAQRIEKEFAQIDAEVAHFKDNQRPSWWSLIYRIPAMVIVVIVLVLTYIFSWFASFVWQPEKHRDKKLK
ncbi:lysophospholipid acyltransferase family protein [Streptococcus macacae]|uniref:Acyltransferase n=1 Tax=Streptococcus macacae NCTC 11558 TaxID=764298 RepID=G5JVT2_9STRE|nr:1-acyl-sn-glycerol-3-phosphate acyltransferase [Streptococcus macacae]EHJ52377.1 acyltransferase [Streptococcus macacae NCTC 11558]SUN78924.1 1-acyl-sn-glycerol-3-phosphate acyltransferase [Streptococcus macacae NCTC 11558]